MAQDAAAPAERRNVLVAVAGNTPAVITETLWALEQQRGIQVDEIRVITTAQGRESILGQLLGPDGHFARYCHDYHIPHGRITFSPKSIHVITDLDGRELQDIRDNEENLAAADQIFAQVREWTARGDEVLYCSVAGGRKTLGIYLAMSLMLCARSQDSLSHVLVSPEFELNVPEFFYPPPEPREFRRLLGVSDKGKEIYAPISSEKASIDLADIPFPRLREALGGDLPLEEGLTRAVEHSQLLLTYLQSPPPLILCLQDGGVQIGRFSFSLSRQLMAVYAFFLRAFNTDAPGASLRTLYDKRPLIAGFERRIDSLRAGEQESYTWENMEEVEDFQARIGPCISKVNRAIERALGRNRLATLYKITTGGRYGVNVPNFQINERSPSFGQLEPMSSSSAGEG